METTAARLRDGIALTFASLFPLAMALIYFVALDAPQGIPNPAIKWAFTVGKCIQFSFPAVYVWWFARSEIRFLRPRPHGIMLGVTFGLLVGMLMFVLYFRWIQYIPAVVEQTPAKIWLRVQEFQSATPLRFLILGSFICCVHSLLEEYYWRWFVFGRLRRHLPVFVAIVLSSVGFMLHHVVVLGFFFPGHFWMLALPLSLCVAVGGGFWAWLYERSGSLYAPWLSHALVDAAIIVLGYQMLGRYWP